MSGVLHIIITTWLFHHNKERCLNVWEGVGGQNSNWWNSHIVKFLKIGLGPPPLPSRVGGRGIYGYTHGIMLCTWPRIYEVILFSHNVQLLEYRMIFLMYNGWTFQVFIDWKWFVTIGHKLDYGQNMEHRPTI